MMADLKLRTAIEAIAILILVVNSSLSKEIPKAEEGKATKDLKVESASYVYSKTDNGPGASSLSHFAGPARFRSIHGLNSGLNFPRFSSAFNYPTKYRVGSFGGVGSGFDGISSDIGTRRFGLSNDLGRTSFGSGISHLDHGETDISSIDSERYGPSSLKFDESDGRDDFDEHSEKHVEKGEKSEEEHESSGEKENSKGYKVVEEFDKGEKGEKTRAQESGQYQAEAGEKKGHEIEENKYGDKEESVQEAKGEHFTHKEGHKKGQKTTGYHNVYHKDEFKKDTTFYDDEHLDSEQEQYSHQDEEHAKSEGEHKKFEKLDEAYEHADKSRNGFFTNGHQYGLAQGHDSQESVKEYQEKQQESEKESKHSSSNEEADSSSSHH